MLKTKHVMKKTVCILLIGMMAACTSGEDQHVYTTKTFNLKGNIKTTTETIRPVIFDEHWSLTPDTARMIIATVHKKHFNERSELVKSELYDDKMNTVRRTKFSHDASGNYTGKKDYDRYNQLKKETKVLKSGGDGIETKTVDAGNNKVLMKTKTRYVDGKPHTRTVENFGMGRMTANYTYTYDKNGNETKVIMESEYMTEGGNNITHYKYLEFDRQGNWTKRIEYREGDENKGKLIEREIMYY